MLNIALDLGGSEVRAKSTESKGVKVTDSGLLIPIDNSVMTHSQGELGEFVIEEEPSGLLDRNRLMVKDSARDSYKGLPLYCDNQKYKTSQDVTYINLIYSIAKLLVDLPPRTPKVGICLPVREFYDSGSKNVFKQRLTGDFTVNFPKYKKVKFTLKKENIVTAPEGAVVFTNLVKKNNLISELKNETCCVIDIGYRSTELILIHNLVAQTNYADSIPIAGIQLEYEIQSLLAKAGLTDVNTREVIQTGLCKTPNGTVNVANIVKVAKSLVAQSMRQKIISFIASNANVRNIENIDRFLFVGRSFSTLVVEEQSTGSLGDEILSTLGSKAGILYPKNLGYANVISLMENMTA